MVAWLRAQVEADRHSPVPRQARYGPGPIDPRFEGGPYDCLRVMCEVDVKLQLIDKLVYFMEGDYAPWNADFLRLLALPYARRPGYDPAWAPS